MGIHNKFRMAVKCTNTETQMYPSIFAGISPEPTIENTLLLSRTLNNKADIPQKAYPINMYTSTFHAANKSISQCMENIFKIIQKARVENKEKSVTSCNNFPGG